jgi:hypothetical protein
MPFDDRERSFENALARHLRPQGSQAECCDAETLAAYHEQSLAPEQMASVKAHISDCARCQAILAQLQATDDLPLPATTSARPHPAAAKPGVRAFPVRKHTPWRWVAPAGALAAALLVWIAVHENTPIRLPKPSSMTDGRRAEVEKTPPASPTVSVPPTLDATKRSEAPAPDAHIGPSVDSRSPIAAAPPQRQESITRQKEFQSARKKSPAGVSGGAIGGQLGSLSSQSVPPRVPQQSRPFPGSVAQSVTVEPAAPEAAAPQTGRDYLAKSEPKAEPKAKSEDDKRDANSQAATPQPGVAATTSPAPAPDALPHAMSQTVEVTAENAQLNTESSEIRNLPLEQRNTVNLANLNRATQLLLAGTTGPVTVSAPGGRVSWRIGHAGVILFSSNAGKTWLVQPSGIVTDLLAGSAPSAKVCWIVGRGGTILRTTDKGKHWKKVKPPIQDDLRSVFAVNARQATVSPAQGTYQTTDGGATWNKLPPE